MLFDKDISSQICWKIFQKKLEQPMKNLIRKSWKICINDPTNCTTSSQKDKKLINVNILSKLISHFVQHCFYLLTCFMKLAAKETYFEKNCIRFDAKGKDYRFSKILRSFSRYIKDFCDIRMYNSCFLFQFYLE